MKNESKKHKINKKMNIQRKFTQDNITEISETEVFVFGSNENGNHAGGAAKQAVEEFGAIEGVAEGLQGKSYAIPTLTKSMEKRTLEQISESVKQFYEFAEENAHLDFIVTKIGCGIAGFKVEEIARIFKAIDFIPFNVTLPMEFTAICGVKGFGKDLYCSKYSKGKQYAENSTFTEPYDLACYKGMHYCENPLDVLRFYTEEFAEVKGEGVIDTKNSDSKVACSTLHVGAKIDFSSVIKLGIDFTLRKTKFLTKKANSEESTAVANREESTAVANSEGSTAVANREGSTAVANREDSTAIANSWNSTAIANRENSTAIANSWDSTAVANSWGSTAVANGESNKVQGVIGAALCSVERDEEHNIVSIASAIVDGEIIKANVFYTCKDGKLVEA